MNGLFSDDSTSPSWTPYSEYYESYIVSNAAENVFADNTYCQTGSDPFYFMYGNQSVIDSVSQWQANGQDAGSVFSSGSCLSDP